MILFVDLYHFDTYMDLHQVFRFARDPTLDEYENNINV